MGNVSEEQLYLLSIHLAKFHLSRSSAFPTTLLAYPISSILNVSYASFLVLAMFRASQASHSIRSYLNFALNPVYLLRYIPSTSMLCASCASQRIHAFSFFFPFLYVLFGARVCKPPVLGERIVVTGSSLNLFNARLSGEFRLSLWLVGTL